MEDSDDERYEELRKFFSKRAWADLSDAEKFVYYNRLDNYKFLLSMGLNAQPPSFMTRQRKEVEEESESDEEWKPYKPKKKEKKFYIPKCFQPKKETRAQPSHKFDLDFPEDDWVFEGFDDDDEGRDDKALLLLEREIAANEKRVDIINRRLHPELYRRRPEWKKRGTEVDNYQEPHVPDDDDYIFCDDCDTMYEEGCPTHTLTWIPDTKVTVKRRTNLYPVKTCPAGLFIKKSDIESAGDGVWTKSAIRKGCVFGPYKGRIDHSAIQGYQGGYSWEIKKFGKPLHYVNADDLKNSNWMRFVNCARELPEQNVIAFQYHGDIYYRTIQDVAVDSEMLVWYGNAYAKDLGIKVNSRLMDDMFRPKERSVYGRFLCTLCWKHYERVEELEDHEQKRHGMVYGDEEPAGTQGPEEKPLRGQRTEQNPVDQGQDAPSPVDQGQDAPSPVDQGQDAPSPADQGQDAPSPVDQGQDAPSPVDQGQDAPSRVDQGQDAPSPVDLGQDAPSPVDQGQDIPSHVDQTEEVHAGVKIKKHLCRYCHQEFTSGWYQKAHEKVHTKDGRYLCRKCDDGTSYKGERGLARHVYKEHVERRHKEEGDKEEMRDYNVGVQGGGNKKRNSGEKRHACNVCHYSTDQKYNLRRHMLTHSNVRAFHCPVCTYTAVQKINLKSHMFKHGGEKPYKCKLCDFATTQNSTLKKHMLTHSGEKPYKCELCDYASTSSSSLKTHMLTHSGEKPYKCELCDYATTNSSNLKTHMFTHSGQKPHKCELCDYATTISRSLKIHMFTHSGQKPHKCELCDYATAWSSALKKHMLTHSGQKPYKCEL